MEGLTQSLIKQKMAGAELTGMDAQLLRAANLRDTKFNDDGAYKAGGIGAAMGAFANVLDRRKGKNEYDGLQGELKKAKQQMAEGLAAKDARAMQYEDQDRGFAADERAALAKARGQEEAQREHQRKLDWAKLQQKTENDARTGSGGGYGKASSTAIEKTIQGIGVVRDFDDIRARYRDNPDLYNAIPGDSFVIGALPGSVQEQAGQLATTMKPLAEGVAKMVGSDDPKAAAQHAVDANAIFQERRNAVSSVLKFIKTGAAGAQREADEMKEYENLAMGQDPKDAARAMDTLFKIAEDTLLARLKKGNYDEAQWAGVTENMSGMGYQPNELGTGFVKTGVPAPGAEANGPLFSAEELTRLRAEDPEGFAAAVQQIKANAGAQ